MKELRLALVLYGGVSLAIYMHGTSKEIHRLVRASALPGDDEGSLTPSEQVYGELLAAKAGEEGVRTRVVVDVIAGTSAGGINGVYLAKALAHDLSQDALRDLWFERGDIGAILRGPKRLPWQSRIPWVLGTVWRWPALDGDNMAVWLFDALEGMDGTAPLTRNGHSLLPAGHELQLFVTVTDFHGYARELVITDPLVIYDRRHRHVMEFRYGDGHDDFRPAALDNAMLAFAARTTSCFPGAFPPVDFRTFEGYLARRKGVEVDLATMQERRLFRQYPLSGADARAAYFVDGGVLDNRPFSHVITAIQAKPAAGEVDRRFLYLEPAPVDPRGSPPARTPGPIATVLASLSGIPRNEPILDEILQVSALNERVRQIRDVIETNWSPVATRVSEILDGVDLADPPADPDRVPLGDWDDRITDQAVADAGLGYAMYVRAKIGDTIDTWARTLCRISRFPDDCTQAAFVRTLLRTWADRADLFQKASAEPTTVQVQFLRDLDLGYRERRLRFVISALSWWYDAGEEDFPLPRREQLDEGKAVLYQAVEDLRTAMRGEDMPEDLLPRMEACFGEEALASSVYLGTSGLDGYLDDRGEALTQVAADFRTHLAQRFSGFGERVYREMHRIAASWDPEARRRLLLRYLGFPFWDTLLFPVQSMAAVGERDHVQITRMSPLDATLLHGPDDGPKLVGTRYHNFGAFFSRAGRESDYLWGRLDGAERLIGILLGREHPEHDAWSHRAFDAILEEESDHLPGAADTIAAVRRQAREGAAHGDLPPAGQDQPA